MATVKNTSQWEADRIAESEQMLAQAEEKIRKFGPSKLGQELMAILENLDATKQEIWTDEEIEKYMDEVRRRQPWQ